MKTITSLFIALFMVCYFAGFGQATTNESGQVLDANNAYTTLVSNCYICHNPRVKNAEDLIAPPMVSVKYLYELRYPEMETFVNNITEFVLNPDNQKAVMQGRVMTHGVMPDLSFEEDEVRRIVQYIFENEIEVPSWYPEYFKNTYGETWGSQ